MEKCVCSSLALPLLGISGFLRKFESCILVGEHLRFILFFYPIAQGAVLYSEFFISH